MNRLTAMTTPITASMFITSPACNASTVAMSPQTSSGRAPHILAAW